MSEFIPATALFISTYYVQPPAYISHNKHEHISNYPPSNNILIMGGPDLAMFSEGRVPLGEKLLNFPSCFGNLTLCNGSERSNYLATESVHEE